MRVSLWFHRFPKEYCEYVWIGQHRSRCWRRKAMQLGFALTSRQRWTRSGDDKLYRIEEIIRMYNMNQGQRHGKQ